MRIVVLCLERERRSSRHSSALEALAEFWRADGHDVHYHFGIKRPPPADIGILHIDLSVVPPEYQALSRHYAVCLNRNVVDIRKSVMSELQLLSDSGWDGAVIVKTDLNYGGIPELIHRPFHRTRQRVTRMLGRTVGNTAYRVFDHVSDVPPDAFDDPSLVVERFVPEREGDLYAVRLHEFLGDRATCIRLVGPDPIVTGATAIRVEEADIDPIVEERRKALGFDYGKFDFVVHGTEPVVIDANKTTGAGDLVATPAMVARRRHRAHGLYSYLT